MGDTGKSFWRTAPGVITAVATLITAIGGVLGILIQNGIIRRTSEEPTQRVAPPAVGLGAADAPEANARRIPEAPRSGSASSDPSLVPTTGRLNLLSSANGGHLVAAPADSWRFAIDDNVDTWEYIQAGAGDGVYAFKDDEAATFDTFMMLIPDTSGLNIKEFELLAGNDTPLGTFHSIGQFQTKNIRLYPSPWQQFKFEPVRARYFKLHVISAWDAGWKTSPKVNEWQLLGSF